MDLVSVIIPVYNVEQYLDVCVKSVIQQTYKNLEIILIDDGSEDCSGQICDLWKKKDDRIEVIHKKNGGLSDARNVGLNRASGEWIIFVDSDDFINKNLVQIVLEYAKNNHSDLVTFEYLEISEQCNENPEYVGKIEQEIYTGSQLLRAFIQTEKGSMVAWNKLYRKEIWKQIRYPVGKIHEDEFVIVDILQNIECATVIDAKLYYYRQRKGSIIDNKNKKADYDALEAYRLRCEKVVDNSELYHLTLNRYLQQLIKIYYEEEPAVRPKLLANFRERIKFSVKYSCWKF